LAAVAIGELLSLPHRSMWFKAQIRKRAKRA